MADVPFEAPKILSIYLQIANYPILAQQIRERMRDELFRRGIVTPAALEEEVRQKATLSQQREGLLDPASEPPQVWEQRLQTIRDHLTDFYFAYNLPLDIFQNIVDTLLSGRSVSHEALDLHFIPELAPLDLLLRQAEQYESLPVERHDQVQHHLEEIVVVLIKTIISDHLGFLRVAKKWFTADDLRFVQSRRIGTGKIGGKAAGMLLAWKILRESAPEVAKHLTLPESYFIGTDVFYDFLSLNSLEYFNQKYKPIDQIRADYPQILSAYEQGCFPLEVAEPLREILEEVGKTPLIVRSSSLLEDNFGTAFAGKYESYFCPNQGTTEENLEQLTRAIRQVYASAFNPDVMLYRRRMGLLDYDERMAILLQEVQGQRYGRFFFPAFAGVGFSYAPILWHPRLRREEGFIRIVAGMGTRAVNRIADDYARLVTLSHPLLRPENSPTAVRRYSQHLIDVIDLEDNAFKTLPIAEVVDLDFPGLRLMASLEEHDTLMPLLSLGRVSPDKLVFTFDMLLQRSGFVPMVKKVLSQLEAEYHFPVDVEFAATLQPGAAQPEITFHLLQCRPQSSMAGRPVRPVPTNVPEGDQIFRVSRMVPQGEIDRIDYVIYVDPLRYSRLGLATRQHEVARFVGKLNKLLEDSRFIMLGPGRWGSANPELGVPITYADIYNARALVEIAVPQQGITPEPSYGTHFFQDLIEAEIYPLAIYLDESGDSLDQDFLQGAENQLSTLLPEAEHVEGCLRVVHIPSERAGFLLDVVMDGEQGLAYFAPSN
jgi:hypothetical protein